MFIAAMVCIIYPIVSFLKILNDGFHVYDDMTKEDMKVSGGLVGKMLYTFRIVFHLYMIVITIYLLSFTSYLVVLRSSQKYAGQFAW